MHYILYLIIQFCGLNNCVFFKLRRIYKFFFWKNCEYIYKIYNRLQNLDIQMVNPLNDILFLVGSGCKKPM